MTLDEALRHSNDVPATTKKINVLNYAQHEQLRQLFKRYVDEGRPLNNDSVMAEMFSHCDGLGFPVTTTNIRGVRLVLDIPPTFKRRPRVAGLAKQAPNQDLVSAAMHAELAALRDELESVRDENRTLYARLNEQAVELNARRDLDGITEAARNDWWNAQPADVQQVLRHRKGPRWQTL